MDRLGAITKAVDIAGKPTEAFERLASWAGRTESQRPIELLTVNYDLLIEAGLEEVGVPYFDGFAGAIRVVQLANCHLASSACGSSTAL